MTKRWTGFAKIRELPLADGPAHPPEPEAVERLDPAGQHGRRVDVGLGELAGDPAPQHEPAPLEGADQPGDVGAAGDSGRPASPSNAPCRRARVRGHRPPEPVGHAGQLVECVTLPSQTIACRPASAAAELRVAVSTSGMCISTPRQTTTSALASGRPSSSRFSRRSTLASTPASRTFSCAERAPRPRSRRPRRENPGARARSRCSPCRSRRPGSGPPAPARQLDQPAQGPRRPDVGLPVAPSHSSWMSGWAGLPRPLRLPSLITVIDPNPSPCASSNGGRPAAPRLRCAHRQHRCPVARNVVGCVRDEGLEPRMPGAPGRRSESRRCHPASRSAAWHSRPRSAAPWPAAQRHPRRVRTGARHERDRHSHGERPGPAGPDDRIRQRRPAGRDIVIGESALAAESRAPAPRRNDKSDTTSVARHPRAEIPYPAVARRWGRNSKRASRQAGVTRQPLAKPSIGTGGPSGLPASRAASARRPPAA